MPIRIVSLASVSIALAASFLTACAHGDHASDPAESSASSAEALTTPEAGATVHVQALDADAGAAIHAQLVEHARCMREHGVDWPDPPEPNVANTLFIARAEAIPAHRLADGAAPGPRLMTRVWHGVDGGPPPQLGLEGNGHVMPRIFFHTDDGAHKTRILRADGGAVPQEAIDACESKLPRGPAMTMVPATPMP